MLVTVTFDAIPATVAGGELPRVGHRVRAPLFTSWTTSKPLVPSQSSFLLLSARRAELERAAPSETAAARRTGKSSPPQLDSSRSNPLHLAPKPLHPSTNAAVPYPGRSQAPERGRHCRPLSSSAPSFAPHVDDPLPAILRAKSIHGEFGRTLLVLLCRVEMAD